MGRIVNEACLDQSFLHFPVKHELFHLEVFQIFMDLPEPPPESLDVFRTRETDHDRWMPGHIESGHVLERLNLESESRGLRPGQPGEFRFVGPLHAHTNVEVLKPRQIPGIGGVIADQDSIGLEDEPDILRNLRQDLEKMIPRKGRLVPADPDLPESLFVGNRVLLEIFYIDPDL